VRREFRLAHQVAEPGRTAESPRAVDEIPHAPRLRAAPERRKHATHGGVPKLDAAEPAM
jgi:hypothetical protein